MPATEQVFVKQSWTRVTKLVLACRQVACSYSLRRSGEALGNAAAVAGAALATTTAGTAHAVPFTTVRREMPCLGFVVSDLPVTCTPQWWSALSHATRRSGPASRQLPPGLPEPYRYPALLWLHFGHGG